jgi:hypothetical protein
MAPKHRPSRNPQRAARLRYRQRRYDLAVASQRLTTAATEALALATTGTMRGEIELLLRELERFIAATGLKIEWPDPARERQEMFRKILEGFRKSPGPPQR